MPINLDVGRRWMARAAARLHRDQSGTISILSVFAVMLLTMLLGMVMNVGRQADGKVRMQNAADASAYSGGVVLARGMNALAFTNHMLCDVFAMTAILREAQEHNAEEHIPRIADAWIKEQNEHFSKLAFPKFAHLGGGVIEQKVRSEQQMIQSYVTMARAVSEVSLPVFEMILAEELIPKYQRAAAATFPEISQMASMEVARRNGEPQVRRGPMLGGFWRTDGMPVGADEMYLPTLPVVDPVQTQDTQYIDTARRQRAQYADRYRRDWNNVNLVGFDHWAYLLRFGSLWRNFTCGQLKRLLEDEYPDSNLPYQIDREASQSSFQDRFMFVGVVYWRKLPHILPGLFTQPIDSDAQAYAQVRVFVPRRRLVWHRVGGGGGSNSMSLGGFAGNGATLDLGDPTAPGSGGGGGTWVVGRQSVPTHWDLLNQHWNCQLVPATGPNLPTILQSAPPLPEFGAADLQLPQLGGVENETLVTISPH